MHGYVCKYVGICVCMYVHVYVPMYICTYVCIHGCMDTFLLDVCIFFGRPDSHDCSNALKFGMYTNTVPGNVCMGRIFDLSNI